MKVASQAVRIACWLAAIGLVGDVAEAADIGPPNASPAETSDQARCHALGEGFFAVKGSDACIRISGYVSAGMGFVEPGRIAAPTTGPFAPSVKSLASGGGSVTAESRFSTDLGPGRLYVQVGGAKWTP